jgi:hydrogenase maturation protein HypF
METSLTGLHARRIAVRGVVQGVGFRPFVYRLAHACGIRGWILNAESGVEIHAEGDARAVEAFVAGLTAQAPPAARITDLEVRPAMPERFATFIISESERKDRPTVRVSPDLPVCDACLRELHDPGDPRYGYPYINCTDCGPRYSIILGLPYDRPQTTMRTWPMCARCAAEYADPLNRRFHAQPVACPTCGPSYVLRTGERIVSLPEAISETVALLRAGSIVAVKGIGGYHLACDARSPDAVAALRERKYRKERPFAVMVRDLAVAERLVHLTPLERELLQSPARPIVLTAARQLLDGVAPDNADLGIMLPYAPLHHLLFDAGAPDVIVMTSANRSSEPIAYQDADARERLHGIADAFLEGEREIARRIDDSVACVGPYGPMLLRYARGYAPGVVASLASPGPVLAVGGDLKNAIALCVGGQVFASQHIGDLDHYPARVAFKQTIGDLCAMYEVSPGELVIAHDAHPQYVSTQVALELPGQHVAVQHHRAHVASVLAERAAWDVPVLGIAFDGTGYGDDGGIWGGEAFRGSLRAGFERVASLRPALLPGGDAAALFPVQAAAGFLFQLDHPACFTNAPFDFPYLYEQACALLEKRVRTFVTTSMGRLFDTVAALVGFTRPMSFEGQAAMWLEHLAQSSPPVPAYPFPLQDARWDFRPLLRAVVEDRLRHRDVTSIARAFHEAVADAIAALATQQPDLPVVLSGGVFQNRLLLRCIRERLGDRVWVNHRVPPNDGGICLGQVAMAVARTAPAAV